MKHCQMLRRAVGVIVGVACLVVAGTPIARAQEGGIVINRPTTTPKPKPAPKPATKPKPKPSTTAPAASPAEPAVKPDSSKPSTIVVPQPAEPPARPVVTKQYEIATGLPVDMVLVEPGSFEMGWAGGESDDQPVHRVTITIPFLLGKYEVTQKQWTAIMGSNPSRFQGDDLPVEQVSFDDVQEFIKRLNVQSGGGWRLPSEAEWEYASRAGSADDDVTGIDAEAWTDANSGGRTHAVGTKRPNAFGLYDMKGNVLEWCADWHVPYTQDEQLDPVHPSMTESKSACRIVRGGSWNDDADASRPGFRFWLAPKNANPLLGFRLARDVPPS